MTKKPPWQAVRKIRAFTLLELLICMSILVIMASFAVPSLQTTQQNQRISQAVTQTLALLHQARLRAMTDARRTTVCLSGDIYAMPPTCLAAGSVLQSNAATPDVGVILYRGDGSTNSPFEVLQTLHHVSQLHSRVRLHFELALHQNRIQFNLRGQANNGSIFIADTRKTTRRDKIVIAVSGRTRVITHFMP